MFSTFLHTLSNNDCKDSLTCSIILSSFSVEDGIEGVSKLNLTRISFGPIVVHAVLSRFSLVSLTLLAAQGSSP